MGLKGLLCIFFYLSSRLLTQRVGKDTIIDPNLNYQSKKSLGLIDFDLFASVLLNVCNDKLNGREVANVSRSDSTPKKTAKIPHVVKDPRSRVAALAELPS